MCSGGGREGGLVQINGFSDSELDGIVGRRWDEAADTTLGVEKEGEREGGREGGLVQINGFSDSELDGIVGRRWDEAADTTLGVELDGIVGRRWDEAADTTLGREREGGREGGRVSDCSDLLYCT